jgi:hypothetical protein
MIFAFLVQTPLYDMIQAREFEGGLYNGYVGFSGTLPESYQSGGNGELDDLIDVHGGITFDSVCDMSVPWGSERIPITECPSEGIYRVVGFDTLHCDDDMFMWNFENTKIETLSLLEQIATLIAKNEILRIQKI